MEEKRGYIKLEELEVYKLSRELSRMGWTIYKKMDWQTRKIIGDQFIESTDSIGANIAESYGRFHYLDRIRFLYNSRGSMIESVNHWLSLMLEREIISKEEFGEFKQVSDKLSLKLNNYIQSIYNSKKELK
ncbi:four helix bundle protein [Belliella kenyensis]|uniref:Four helix bundle protein n=1 Tax=Belliella kenyensis TaxID=1472724 RepID=A0ABV8EL38_9BACT|nr:four helix bundle protein [Belliella kenyensis]MCH7400624.1 four helix bundle protein [Belliella kenyensis]MDN3602089.1 four helix bundle protein [Belliella kenyensis]